MGIEINLFYVFILVVIVLLAYFVKECFFNT